MPPYSQEYEQLSIIQIRPTVPTPCPQDPAWKHLRSFAPNVCAGAELADLHMVGDHRDQVTPNSAFPTMGKPRQPSLYLKANEHAAQSQKMKWMDLLVPCVKFTFSRPEVPISRAEWLLPAILGELAGRVFRPVFR